MISRTAKVAIPAASPVRRMSGRPTASAKTPPATAARSSDGTLPTVACRRKPKRLGMKAGFSPVGTDRTPAVHAPSATKLMCPKESTPVFPMKMYRPTTITTLTSASTK